MTARYLARWELSEVTGTVVAIDVLRAFTSAAYAFAAGASAIWVVGGVDEARRLGASIEGAVVMGEDRGRRPPGFHLSNSPVAVSRADLDGRVVVQRTSAGTRGVIAAASADRLFAASLVCASATAAAVGADPPVYVITGRFADDAASGEDDLLTAQLIERARVGDPLDAATTAAGVAASPEAARTRGLGDEHVHPQDIAFALDVDRFDFAMRVERVAGRHRLLAVRP